MRAAIISLGSKSSLMIVEEMKKVFEVVDMLDIRKIEISIGSKATGILHEGKPIEKYDCVLIKGSFRYSVIQSAIASILDGTCFMPYGKNSFTTVHDKVLTHLALEKEKIPMPKTYLAPTPAAAKAILEQIPYPVIIKIPNGTQGKGVMFADSFASANSVLDTLTTLRQPFLIQEFIETDASDLRVFVVGDKVIACMKRKAGGEDKRANLHAGGNAEIFLPDDRLKRIAIKTAQILNAGICGIDILESPRGPLVIEANISPGLQGITAATKINIAEIIAKYLIEKTKEFIENKNKATSLHNLINDEKVAEFSRENRNNSYTNHNTGNKFISNNNHNNTNSNNNNYPLNKVDTTKISKNNMIITLDFRGERILLPKILTKNFKEGEEYFVEVENDELHIKKFK